MLVVFTAMVTQKLFAFCQQDDEALYARVYLHDHRWTDGGHFGEIRDGQVTQEQMRS